MSMDKPEESGITSKNPLLRKIAQLESAAVSYTHLTLPTNREV